MTGPEVDPAVTWLTELDGIQDSWNVTIFKHSSFGRLPTELLDTIIQYIPIRYLPSLSRISPVLRELVEKRLYRHIIVSGRTASAI
jgi:hypothetical protein